MGSEMCIRDRYYDPKKPVGLQVDACKSGLGAVLVQDSSPIAYAPRSLTETECRYAQIEKELLAVVFGVFGVPPIYLREGSDCGDCPQTFGLHH